MIYSCVRCVCVCGCVCVCLCVCVAVCLDRCVCLFICLPVRLYVLRVWLWVWLLAYVCVWLRVCLLVACLFGCLCVACGFRFECVWLVVCLVGCAFVCGRLLANFYFVLHNPIRVAKTRWVVLALPLWSDSSCARCRAPCDGHVHISIRTYFQEDEGFSEVCVCVCVCVRRVGRSVGR